MPTLPLSPKKKIIAYNLHMKFSAEMNRVKYHMSCSDNPDYLQTERGKGYSNFFLPCHHYILLADKYLCLLCGVNLQGVLK